MFFVFPETGNARRNCSRPERREFLVHRDVETENDRRKSFWNVPAGPGDDHLPYRAFPLSVISFSYCAGAVLPR